MPSVRISARPSGYTSTSLPVKSVSRAEEETYSTCAIGMPATVQVIGTILRIRQRPIVFVAPLIQAHHKDLHRFVLLHPILLPFEPVIVPAQLHPLQINGLAARHQAVRTLREHASAVDVGPWTDDQTLVGTGQGTAPALFHVRVIGQRPPQEQSIPTTHVEGRGRQ